MGIEIKNKKAKFLYHLVDTFTAGIMLRGTEIKSIRKGKASIVEGYCRFDGNDLFVYNMNIAEYENAGWTQHAPKRARKLLLNQTELNKLKKKLKDVGLTVIPTLLFINESGLAKLEIALAKGKKLYDKREDLKQKSQKRDIDRAMK